MTATDSNATLLPCPFCGGEAWEPLSKKWTNALGDESWSAYVHCPECNLTVETKSCGYETAGEAESAIIEEWNTRTPEPPRELVHCRDCENASHYYPWRYNGERSTIERWTCALMAEGEEVEPGGFCAFGERRKYGSDR